jgi:hypothetical protein
MGLCHFDENGKKFMGLSHFHKKTWPNFENGERFKDKFCRIDINSSTTSSNTSLQCIFKMFLFQYRMIMQHHISHLTIFLSSFFFFNSSVKFSNRITKERRNVKFCFDSFLSFPKSLSISLLCLSLSFNIYSSFYLLFLSLSFSSLIPYPHSIIKTYLSLSLSVSVNFSLSIFLSLSIFFLSIYLSLYFFLFLSLFVYLSLSLSLSEYLFLPYFHSQSFSYLSFSFCLLSICFTLSRHISD